MADALIIGAGVIGSSIALELSKKGYAVIVVDKGPTAGAGSTSSSSAIIRFSYSTWDGVVTSWESMHHWKHWADHLGLVDEAGMARFVRTGMLVLDTPGRSSSHILSLFDRAGVPYEEWDGAELRRRVPALDPSSFWPPRVPTDDAFWDEPHGEIGGFFTPDAGFVDDPQLAAHNLMVAATAQGAEFRFRKEVVGLTKEAGRVTGVDLAGGEHLDGAVVVNAAGPYSSRVNTFAGVLDDFGVTTRALRQEVHAAAAPAHFTVEDRGVVVADGDLGTYFRPHLGGTVLVGGIEAECDELIWVDNPDELDEHPTAELFETYLFRLARRLPELKVPGQPLGLAALYDVSDDWIPIYDRTSLDGFYVAIGTSGNQFKNAPTAGALMAALIESCSKGHDHDADPVTVVCQYTGHTVNLGHYSRVRQVNKDSSFSVFG